MKMALSVVYKFNEGSGSTLIDDGPNGINGNINGAGIMVYLTCQKCQCQKLKDSPQQEDLTKTLNIHFK